MCKIKSNRKRKKKREILFNGQNKIGLERRQMKKNKEVLVNWKKLLFQISKKF